MKFNQEKLYEHLEWCGCSDGDIVDAFNKVVSYMLEGEHGHQYFTDIVSHTGLDKITVQLILLELDRAGITEHGTSVRGSWIDGDGRELIRRLSDES